MSKRSQMAADHDTASFWRILERVLRLSKEEEHEKNLTKQRLHDRLRADGLRMRGEMPMDGNCFFHACCDQLSRFGIDYDHKQLRKRAADYLRQHPYTPSGEHMEATVENQDWDAYLERIATVGEWADHQVIIATAEVTGRDIKIWSSHSAIPIVIKTRVQAEEELEPILLGHISEVHYESLEPEPLSNNLLESNETPSQPRIAGAPESPQIVTSDEVPIDLTTGAKKTKKDDSEKGETSDEEEQKLLLAVQSNANKEDEQGEAVDADGQELILAIQSKDIERISDVLKKGVSVHCSGKKTKKIQLNQTSVLFLEDVYNCIHYAAAVDDPKIVKLLVEQGAQVNERSHDWRYTPLMIAAGFGNLDTVKELLNLGASINLQDRFGATSLHNAVKGNKLDVAVFLMEKGSNVNTTDNDLSSPLHYAVQEGHRDVIKFLIDNGADVLQRNREGKTAFSSGSSDIQSWLQNVMMQRKYKELYAEGTVPLGTVKVCFIGSAGAGKTTLMESMLRRFLERLLGSKENQPDEPDRSDLRTVGVNFKQVDVPGLGDCLLFDFAGQEQFHKTHGLLFPATKSVFILLVSLMVGKDEMVKQAKYWLSFLRACFDDSVKPIVLMAASRGDQCPEDSEERIEFGHVVEYMRQLFNGKVIIKESSVVLDCRKSSSDAMQQLKNLLDGVRTEFIEAQKYPRICVPARRLIHSLKKKGHQFMETADLRGAIEKSIVVDIDVGRCTELNAQTMEKVFDFLNDTAEILIYPTISISVLDVLWLCQFIIGPLLAPKHFPCHLMSKRHDGQVNLSDIKTALEEMVAKHKHSVKVDVKTVVPLVEHLDLCFKVKGKQDVYLFPAHLPHTKPSKTWLKEDRMKVYIGRRVQCVSETSIVSPGTFNFFQCRAYAKLDQEKILVHVAKAWRNGIILSKDAHGCPVECLCTIHKLFGQVDFIVRGGEGSQSDCLSLLRTVMDLWDQARNQHSIGTECEIWYLSRLHIKDHEEIPGAYSKEEIEKAKEGGPFALVRTADKDYDIKESLMDLVVYEHIYQKSAVCDAVLKHGAGRWYAFGVKFGYSHDEIQQLTFDKVNASDKLLAIISQKAAQIGQPQLEELLLEACGDIQQPIIGAVLEELQTESSQ